MAVVETYHLTKKYKDVYAVRDVNMRIEEGDIYGFVGENGAGKTTIIRLLTGLAAPTSGGYSLYGINNGDPGIRESRKRMGGIVEAASVIGSMTALENLRFQSTVCGVKKTDAQLIEMIGNAGLDYDAIRTRRVGNFSLGMRQRLGIAMALVSDPTFIILDEPMNGLDPRGFVEIRETVLRLNRQGITFFISSHILSELDKICNRIGFISHGELLEEASVADLHRQSRKHIAVTCGDTGALTAVLQSAGVTDFEVSGDIVRIYGDADINMIMKILVERQIPVRSINVNEDTVEGYYFRLLERRNAR